METRQQTLKFLCKNIKVTERKRKKQKRLKGKTFQIFFSVLLLLIYFECECIYFERTLNFSAISHDVPAHKVMQSNLDYHIGALFSRLNGLKSSLCLFFAMTFNEWKRFESFCSRIYVYSFYVHNESRL